MGAHEHGVSKMEIAVDGSAVEINLLSPGMDIVGFEYEPSTAADKDAVEAAIRVLVMPETVVSLPDAAGCRLGEVVAHLHAGDHDHDEGEDHAQDDHEHEDHADGGDHDHDGEEHDHDGEDHDHMHSEFHAHYAFTCEHPEKLTTLSFPFFAQFPNAQEIEAQYVTDAGAGSAEIPRDAAKLTLN